MAIVFGDNQYGKAEVRLVHVDRTARRAPHQGPHRLDRVARRLRSRAPARATTATSSRPTPRRTPCSRSRSSSASAPIEDFGLRLGRHFVDGFDWVSGAKVTIAEQGWDRIGADPHAFTRAGGGTRTAVVTIDGDEAYVLAGLTDLVVLKTTDSEFTGFPRDRYTTLPEDRDRILATAVTARWRYAHTRGRVGRDVRGRPPHPHRHLRGDVQPRAAADALRDGTRRC